MIDPKKPEYEDKPGSSDRPHFNYVISKYEYSPYVSIVTPFYNTDVVFYETANSVLNQSFQQFEWIIINDSTDNSDSLSILDDFRNKDTRIKIIDHQFNKGLSAARNTGFRAAVADYVLQIDSDDLLEETALEKWLWYLESHPQYSFCKGFSIGFGAQEYLWEDGFLSGRSFLRKNLTDATCLIKKDAHNNVGGYNEELREGLEDWDFWLKCADSGYWGSNIPEFLNWYRRRQDHTDKWKNFNSSSEWKEIISRFRNQYPGLWRGNFPFVSNLEYQKRKVTTDISKFKNILNKDKNRIIVIISSLDNEFEYNIAYNLIKQLMRANYELSLIVLNHSSLSKLSEITKLTPDVFILPNFLKLEEYPRFMIYFLISRQIDCFLNFNCGSLFPLLPFIKEHLPHTRIVPVISDEDKNKLEKNKRYLTEYDQFIDVTYCLNTKSENIWFRDNICSNIIDCSQIIDTDFWSPDGELRIEVRHELNIPKDNKVVICYYGDNLNNIKPIVLLGVILKLTTDIDDSTFIIAGDGVNWEWLNQNLKINSVEHRCRRIWITSDTLLSRLYASADIFFCPYETQNEEYQIWQAMSSGLCVVGVNNNYSKHITFKEFTRLIDYTNELDETDQFISIIRGLVVNNMTAGLGRISRLEIKSKFSVDNISDSLIDYIDKNFNSSYGSNNINGFVPEDKSYNDIKNMNIDLCDGFQRNDPGNIYDRNIIAAEIYRKYQEFIWINEEFEKLKKHDEELRAGIEFWQKNSNEWQYKAEDLRNELNISNEKLQKVSNNIIVKILVKLGIIRNTSK